MTDALIRGRDLVGRPVVSLASGEDLAEVRDVVFDPASGQVGGFTLNKRGFLGGRMKVVLTTDSVASVGTDAVMVADEEALQDRREAEAELHARDGREVVDDAVITESGRRLGTVKDVVIVGGARPRVVGFEIDGPAGRGLIPLGAQAGVSASALIVPDQYEGRVRSDLTGLAAELADIERGRS